MSGFLSEICIHSDPAFIFETSAIISLLTEDCFYLEYSFADGKLSDNSYPSNTVLGFEPRYLIRDYLKAPPRPLLYTLYYEMSQPEEFRFIRTTGNNTAFIIRQFSTPFIVLFLLDLFNFDLSSVSYSTSSDGSAVTISFPSIDKSTQFKINVNGNNAAMLHEKSVDGSPRLTVSKNVDIF